MIITDTYHFPNHTSGNTFDGHQFEIFQNEVPVDLSGATIKIQFRTTASGRAILKWSTEDGSITISGADNNEINMGLKPGPQMVVGQATYKYDIVITLANGVTNTYVKGTMKILERISRMEDN